MNLQTTEDALAEFNKSYTNIGLLQKRLPSKKGKNDYSEIEDKIISMARDLKFDIFKFLLTLKHEESSNEFISQLDSLHSGASEIEKNPYLRLILV